jgi:hypothetical protein
VRVVSFACPRVRISPCPRGAGVGRRGLVAAVKTGEMCVGHGQFKLGSVNVVLGRAQFTVDLILQYSNILHVCNSNQKASRVAKMFKLCMRLDLNLVNNCLHWTNFKFSMDLMF